MEKMEITKTVYRVSDFISWMKANNLIMTPTFQRRSVWKNEAKSYLIDTIIRGLPVPIIFLREQYTDLKTLEPKYQVIDGQQRLRTLFSYIKPDLLKDYLRSRDEFILKKTHNEDFPDYCFNDLPIKIKQDILDYKFSVHILPNNIDDRDVLQIFSRMNSTGVKLNHQELRNAEYFGEFKTSVYKYALKNLNRWRDWKIFSEDNIARMYEVEFTSELYAFIINGFEDKNQKNINDLYKKNDASFNQRKIIENRFQQTLDLIDYYFDKELSNSIYHQRTIFYILFSIIYDEVYGINSKLILKKPTKIKSTIINRILNIGSDIEKKGVDEVITSGTRRLSTQVGREELFNYIKINLKNA